MNGCGLVWCVVCGVLRGGTKWERREAAAASFTTAAAASLDMIRTG
jgi:hypothetical protein